ncbi:hypothetical protein E3Q09_03760 [Wallemia mellicola]|nr:hypothetical protein E3Q09_03760 [Wallemia mellicola]
MAPKRPAGLGAASKAKKNKQEEPNKEERSNVVPPTQEDTENGDDWLDLLELWEKCKTSLNSNEPASSAPLLRGILHETSRLVDLNGTDLSGFKSVSENGEELQVSVSHFRLILASALLELGILISASARFNEKDSLAAEGEPKTGSPFFFRAYSVAKTVEDQVFIEDSELVAGRCAAEYLKERTASGETSNDPDDELKEESNQQLLEIATESISKCNLDTKSPTLLLSLGSLLSTLEEDIINIENPSTALSIFETALKKADNTQTKFELLIGKARVLVSRGGYVIDKLFDEEDPSGKSKVEGYVQQTVNELRVAINSLEEAQNMSDDLEVGESEANELTSLLKEAMIFLANLLPEGEEQEELFKKAGVEDEEEDEEA